MTRDQFIQWLIAPKPTEWMTGFAAFAGIIGAYWTGIFNKKRILLKIQEKRLEQRTGELEKETADLEKQKGLMKGIW